MTLLSGVLALAIVVYANVLVSDRSSQRTTAKLAIDEVALALSHEKLEPSQRMVVGDLVILVEYVPGPGNTDIARFSARNKEGDVFLVESRLVPRPCCD